jgi:hypothetical protein
VVLIDKHEHAGDLRIREVLRDQIHGKLVNRPFQFQKRSQLFISTHDKALSVAMGVRDPAGHRQATNRVNLGCALDLAVSTFALDHPPAPRFDTFL